MEDFEKRLKARSAKIHNKLDDLLKNVKKSVIKATEMNEKFEKFAEEHHKEKALKIKKILG